jgi:hypothetical protein
LQHLHLLQTAVALPHVPGSPRLEVLRRLRPAHWSIGRRRTQPTRHAGRRAKRQTMGGSRVHHRFARRRRSPTLPQQPRCEYAADVPRSLPVLGFTTPESSPPRPQPAMGYAPHPAHIHQVRAGKSLRGFKTSVPRVLLSNPLAGPTPSGGTGAVHPGFVRTASTRPGASRDRLSSAPTRPLRRPSGGGLPPPLESTAPHGARSQSSTHSPSPSVTAGR